MLNPTLLLKREGGILGQFGQAPLKRSHNGQFGQEPSTPSSIP